MIPASNDHPVPASAADTNPQLPPVNNDTLASSVDDSLAASAEDSLVNRSPTSKKGKYTAFPRTPLRWGTWGQIDSCDGQGLASGFEQRWEPPGGAPGEFRTPGENMDMANNLKMGTAGIHLKCGASGKIIASKEVRM